MQSQAKEALDFARKNVGHSSFTEIFSSRLQYEPVIQNLLLFDATGGFVREYFRQLRIDSAYIGDALPETFQAAVDTAAKSAIQPTLVSLAHYLQVHQNIIRSRSKAKIAKVTAIRTSPSFLNEKGTIPFSENSGKFRIQQSSELEQIAQYRPVIDRAIRKLVEARTFQRIDNRDRILADLLSKYHDEVCRSADEIRISIMWTCGLEIEQRIVRQDSIANSDENLSEEDLFDLRRLLVAHNLFLNCFSQSASLLRDIESSAAIYQRIDIAARRLSPMILRKASEDSALVEEETAKTILRSISQDAEENTIKSEGQAAIRLGLLRGLLHAAGGHLLGGIEKVIEKTSVDMTSKLLVDSMRADGNFTATIVFFHRQASALIQISDQVPVYFGYIRNLLAMFGLYR